MRKILTSLFMAAAWLSFAQTGNVGVNTTTPDAVLEVYSTTKGVLVPRLTTAQRDAMVSPLNSANKVQEGTIIYNLDQHCLQYNVAPTGNTPNWVGYGCGGVVVTPGSITNLNCAGATTTGTLTSGTAASGVSSVISYTGGNGGSHSGQTVTSTGVTGLTAKLAAGSFATGTGNLTYTITGKPASSGTASFAINIGGQPCTLTRTVAATITVASPTYQGTSVINTTGIGYNGENIPAGSTITVQVTVTEPTSYNFSATHAGTGLVYSATGSFAAAGTYPVVLQNNGVAIPWDTYGVLTMPLTGASNSINLVPRIDIKSIPASATAIVNVTYGTQTWMDRNLGARRVATAINDVLSYGNHYQWGRPADGHEITVWNGDTPTNGRGFADATALGALSATTTPGHPNFILTNAGTYDWLATQADPDRWATANQGPCPAGYHVPTEAQWATADAFNGGAATNGGTTVGWDNNTETYNSALKLPSAGYRPSFNNSLYSQGSAGRYWSSTVSGTNARYLEFLSVAASTRDDERAYGLTVRCLKD